MRTHSLALLCVLLVGCAGGPTLKVYYRTSPRRVAVSKTPTPSVLSATATRQEEGIDVHLKGSSAVSISRVLHYNSSMMEYLPNQSLGMESLEMFLGVLSLMVPSIWGVYTHDPSPTATRKVVRLVGPLRGLLDPTVSVFANEVRDTPVVTDDVFIAEPVVREYDIRVPSSTAGVAYRVLDVSGRELAKGTAIPSQYGELGITGDFKVAVAVELTVDRSTIVIPVRDTPSVLVPAVARPLPHIQLTRPLANDGWAEQGEIGHFLPRLNVMIDLEALAGGDRFAVVELRLARRWSVGGAVADESIEKRLQFADGKIRIRQLGALSRLYVLGDVGIGIHVGLEGMIGVDGPLTLRSYGPTLGGKYTLDCGISMELMYGLRHVSIGDPHASEPLVSDWHRRAYLNVGWSF
jgi:hypothetical protein